MKQARIYVNGEEAGILKELMYLKHYVFEYNSGYSGQAVSLTMPTTSRIWEYKNFPPFFDGLLPEGFQLEGLLKIRKLGYNFKRLIPAVCTKLVKKKHPDVKVLALSV